MNIYFALRNEGMFKGSIVALVTPMDKQGHVDVDALRRLVEMHVECGTDAIVAVGTTGESATLSHKEQQLIIKHVIEQVNKRIPVIAGTGATSTSVAQEATIAAMAQGVDACLLMTPAYIKPTQEGLFLHYQQIAQAAAIPQILYNVPSRTACDMLPETVARLANIPNIIGIKEATGQVERSQTILEQCGDKLDVYSGEDGVGLDLMKIGAKGIISVTANVAPELMQHMCAAALSGDIARAEQLNEKLLPLHKALFVESNPIPCKWALSERGLISSGIRLPLTPLTASHHGTVREAMATAGIV